MMKQILLLLSLMLLSNACGQLITPVAEDRSVPTPTLTPTLKPLPTVTARPTATPKPATPEPTPTFTPTPTPIIHTVQSGDTLLSIAIAYNVSVEAIQTANGITDPRFLQIEQVLVIPNPEDTSGDEPTPTPTPFPVIVQGLNFEESEQDTLWAFGEIVNPGDITLSEVVVEISLFDAEGRLLASQAAYPQLDLLAPDYSVPFALLFEEPPSSFAQYQVSVISAKPIYGQPSYYLDLQPVETSATWLSDASYHIQGQLENVGTFNAEAIKLVAVAYDEANRVIGQRQAFLAVELLRSKARTDFSITLNLPNSQVSRYAVQAQAQRSP